MAALRERDGGLVELMDSRDRVVTSFLAASREYNLRTRYGAGSTGDDTTAWQTAINEIRSAGGGTLVIPKGTYKITAPITSVGAFTRFLWDDNAILDASAVPASNNIFGTQGTTNDASPVSLAVDCAKGATSLSVGAGNESGFVVGDYVKIGSHKQWSADVALADPTMDGWRGEIGIVESISSGTLNLRWPTYDAYAVADSGFVSKMPMVAGISMSGPGTIIGGGNNANHIGFKLDRCLHLRMEDVTWQNFDVTALQVRDGFDVKVDGVTFLGGTSSTTNFYGIAWQYASMHCTMISCEFRDVRHAATLDQVQGVRSGVPRHITYENCKAYDTTASSYDAHAYGEYLTIKGCHSYNAAESGISVRSPSAEVVSNFIVGCGQHGIYLRNQTSESSRYTVSDNIIIRAGLAGINWRTPPEAALAGTTAGQVIDGVEICDNTVIDPAQDGIIAQSAAGFTNLYQCDIHDNLIQYTGANAQNGLTLIRVSDSSLHDNIVKGANLGLSIDNNCLRITRGGNRFPGCTTALSPGTSIPFPYSVGTLGVGNSAAATTPGSVVKKIEVYDELGNSLGFVPVYSAIT